MSAVEEIRARLASLHASRPGAEAQRDGTDPVKRLETEIAATERALIEAEQTARLDRLQAEYQAILELIARQRVQEAHVNEMFSVLLGEVESLARCYAEIDTRRRAFGESMRGLDSLRMPPTPLPPWITAGTKRLREVWFAAIGGD